MKPVIRRAKGMLTAWMCNRPGQNWAGYSDHPVLAFEAWRNKQAEIDYLHANPSAPRKWLNPYEFSEGRTYRQY